MSAQPARKPVPCTFEEAERDLGYEKHTYPVMRRAMWNVALESVQSKLEAGEALAREVNKAIDDQQRVSPSSMTSCEIILTAALTRYRAAKDSR